MSHMSCSVWPKPGFGKQNQSPISVSVSEPQKKFWNRNVFPSVFFNFIFLGGNKFLKVWNWTQIFKNNLKIFNIGAILWWKKYPILYYVSVTRFFLCNIVLVFVTILDNFGFVSVSDLNQNSGFGRTIICPRILVTNFLGHSRTEVSFGSF